MLPRLNGNHELVNHRRINEFIQVSHVSSLRQPVAKTLVIVGGARKNPPRPSTNGLWPLLSSHRGQKPKGGECLAESRRYREVSKDFVGSEMDLILLFKEVWEHLLMNESLFDY